MLEIAEQFACNDMPNVYSIHIMADCKWCDVGYFWISDICHLEMQQEFMLCMVSFIFLIIYFVN